MDPLQALADEARKKRAGGSWLGNKPLIPNILPGGDWNMSDAMVEAFRNRPQSFTPRLSTKPLIPNILPSGGWNMYDAMLGGMAPTERVEEKPDVAALDNAMKDESPNIDMREAMNQSSSRAISDGRTQSTSSPLPMRSPEVTIDQQVDAATGRESRMDEIRQKLGDKSLSVEEVVALADEYVKLKGSGPSQPADLTSGGKTNVPLPDIPQEPVPPVVMGAPWEDTYQRAESNRLGKRIFPDRIPDYSRDESRMGGYPGDRAMAERIAQIRAHQAQRAADRAMSEPSPGYTPAYTVNTKKINNMSAETEANVDRLRDERLAGKRARMENVIANTRQMFTPDQERQLREGGWTGANSPGIASNPYVFQAMLSQAVRDKQKQDIESRKLDIEDRRVANEDAATKAKVELLREGQKESPGDAEKRKWDMAGNKVKFYAMIDSMGNPDDRARAIKLFEDTFGEPYERPETAAPKDPVTGSASGTLKPGIAGGKTLGDAAMNLLDSGTALGPAVDLVDWIFGTKFGEEFFKDTSRKQFQKKLTKAAGG